MTCECTGVVLYDDHSRVCNRCGLSVPMPSECESCGCTRDILGVPTCGACTSRFARIANELARRVLGCGEEQCEHEQRRLRGHG